METGSPGWLEKKVQELCHDVFSSFVSAVRKYPLVFFCILSVVISCFILNSQSWLPWLEARQNHGHGNLVRFRLLPFLFLIVCGPGLWLLRNTDLLFQNSLASVVVLTFTAILMGPAQALVILATYFCLVFPLLVVHRWSFPMKVGFLLVSTFFCMVGEAFFVHAFPTSGYIIHMSPIFRWVLPLSMGLLEAHARVNDFSINNRKTCTLLFSPATFLILQPLRSDFVRTPADPLSMRLQGFVDLATALFAFVLCNLDLRYFPVFETDPAFVGWWLAGLRMSLAYFFSCWGIFRGGAGVGRWLGFSLPDNTNFAILAVTPTESWRRWSIYLYQWMFVALFLPTQRRWKTTFVSCIVTFTAMFLLHRSFGVVRLFVENEDAPRRMALLRDLLFFWTHGLLIYFTFVTNKFWPKNTRRTGWLGILATQSLLAWVHAILVV